MGRFLFTLFAVTLLASVARAQEPPRIYPGFEKVYKESKKKEAEALRAIAAANAEIAASEQLRLDGERQIADAEQAIRSQQLSYLTLTRAFGAAQTARDARMEAAQLEAAARAWADAEEMKEKGTKTVLAAEASRARAAERLASAQGKQAEAQAAIARTLQDAPAEQIAQPTSLTPTAIEELALPPAATETSASPRPSSAKPKAALDTQLLGGPEGDRP